MVFVYIIQFGIKIKFLRYFKIFYQLDNKFKLNLFIQKFEHQDAKIVNQKTKEFCTLKGILDELTEPYTLQYNNIVEQFSHTKKKKEKKKRAFSMQKCY